MYCLLIHPFSKTFIFSCMFALSLSFIHQANAVFQSVNYDESKIPSYVLPEVLVTQKGQPVTTTEQWKQIRRAEIIALFEEHMFGKKPAMAVATNYEVILSENDDRPPIPHAIRRQIKMVFNAGGKTNAVDLLVYLPEDASEPVPLFLTLNFHGNHTVVNDPAVPITNSWVRNQAAKNITQNRSTKEARGMQQSRWPVAEIVKRGYGLATIYYGDIDPDYHDQFKNGIHAVLDTPNKIRPSNAWGSIAAWAWGLSRAMDYFETVPQIDSNRIAVFGHSRLGKTALWAGAQDARFAMVIVNNSGCGGAALSRREIGETVARINQVFPHWFCKNFRAYGDRVNDLPIDQHLLIAAIAPRPIYVASASDDRWADPRGEFLALKKASPAYALWGLNDLSETEMPSVNQSIGRQMGYHLREGKHDVTPYDWKCFMDFADLHFQIDDARNGRN